MSNNDLKEKIINSISIESYISLYVKLKKAGRTLKGLCPFHSEKTPSFSVTPDKGIYYCFGCGKGGDLIKFVMDKEGVDFPRALETLAKFANIKIEKNFNKYDSTKALLEKKFFEINEKALYFFQEFLESKAGLYAKSYLNNRGIDDKTISFFKIGACPNKWDFIKTKLNNYNEKDLIEIGLIKAGKETSLINAGKETSLNAGKETTLNKVGNESLNNNYDFYRNRIIFPILNLDKKIAGFGGRIIENQNITTAKYINSPDSTIFKKGRLLFGLSQNLQDIRLANEIIIVEGYLDVIGLFQVGIKNAVAPLGTALNQEQFRLIANYTKKIILMFDGDEAGIRAAKSAYVNSLEIPSLEISICVLPYKTDPFDLTRNFSNEQIKIFLENKINSNLFFLMESLQPYKALNIFKELNGINFATNARMYYNGELKDSLPKDLEKRNALNILYNELDKIPKQTEIRLLLEATSRLLKLDVNEIQQEWLEKNPHISRNSSRNSYNKNNNNNNNNNDNELESFNRNEISYKKEFPLHNKNEKEFSTPKNENYNLDSKFKKNLNKSKNSLIKNSLINCERILLLELLLNPILMDTFYNLLKEIEFEDLHSEILWRHLESCYILGTIWARANISELNLPEETFEIFNAFLFKEAIHKQSENIIENVKIMNDYLLKHSMLINEKNIDEKSAQILVADSVNKSDLIEEKSLLIKELNLLKSRWRNPKVL